MTWQPRKPTLSWLIQHKGGIQSHLPVLWTELIVLYSLYLIPRIFILTNQLFISNYRN